MSLHRLLAVIIGVPNVHETAAYYADFGLTRGGAAGSAPPTPALGRPPPSFRIPRTSRP